MSYYCLDSVELVLILEFLIFVHEDSRELLQVQLAILVCVVVEDEPFGLFTRDLCYFGLLVGRLLGRWPIFDVRCFTIVHLVLAILPKLVL